MWYAPHGVLQKFKHLVGLAAVILQRSDQSSLQLV